MRIFLENDNIVQISSFLKYSLLYILELPLILSFIAVIGIFYNDRNLFFLVIYLDLFLLAINLNFILFSLIHQDLKGFIMVLFVLAYAAVESAMGLAIFISYYLHFNSLNPLRIGLLHGRVLNNIKMFYGFETFIKSFVGMFFINLLYLLCLLVAIAYFTLLERKLMASVQRRTGPCVVGFYGILQPIADGLKLLTKEIIIPRKANKIPFLLAPLLSLVSALFPWCFIPFDGQTVMIDLPLNLLFILLFSSLNIYGLIISGRASNSKYAFLGALRSTAQVIPYELSLGFIFLTVGMFAGSFNLSDIVFYQAVSGVWLGILCLPLVIIFIIVMLAETNRIPFDLAEAEAEIVAGYNIEYSPIVFAMFFLAEYPNILLMSAVMVLLFSGGWYSMGHRIEESTLHEYFFEGSFFFCTKIVLFAIFFILVRSSLPRYRYDKLMYLGWKVLLPLTFSLFIFYAGLIKKFGLSIPEYIVILTK